MFEEEEDQQVGGGFYSFTSASAISEEGSEGVSGGVGHWQLDLDASSRVPAIDQFIDTKHLTSAHVLEPPTTGTGAGAGAGAGEGGKSFVQHGQEQFEEGEKCKFVDAVKAKQHYSLAALYFRKAADELKEITAKKSLIYLADNAETMSFILDKALVAAATEPLSPSAKSPLAPRNGNGGNVFDAFPSRQADDGSNDLSESAYNLESVLNAPHHYDRIYTVLPMSSSMSFFGGFNTAPVPSEENSRASLAHSRGRAVGVSSVPMMDLSSSSSFSSSRPGNSGSASTIHISKPMQRFVQDLRLLERRLGSIGLMPLTESAAATSLRHKDNVTSQSALTSSTARLNFLSSRLDESFIMLSQDIQNTSFRAAGTGSTETRKKDPNCQPNPYGNRNSTEKGNNSSSRNAPDTSESSSTSDQTGYWGAGIMEIASKITGIASKDASGEKKNKSSGLSSAPYGGAAAMPQHQAHFRRDINLQSNDDDEPAIVNRINSDVGQSMRWNECSTLLPSTYDSEIHKGNSNSTSRKNDTIRGRTESWESVSSAGVIDSELLDNTHKSTSGLVVDGSVAINDGSEGILRLLSTIERLSAENSRLEETVESLKSAQNKNSLLTAQIDQFKVEYKLKIDQMKSEILRLSTNGTNTSTGASGLKQSKDSMHADARDKKLNELERTVSALLRKMTEMKQESDKKDDVIKHYKARRDKRQKEKRENQEKVAERGNSKDGDSSASVISGQKQATPTLVPDLPSESPSLSTRRGVAMRTVSTSAATATATAGYNVPDTGFSQTGSNYNNRNNGQSRNRISLTSASPSTATTLRTSLKREISAGNYSPSRPNSSLRKGHQQQRK